MNTIGEKLKTLREKSRLSQKQLASYLDIDQSYLSKIESNERQVNIEILDKLAILFGLEIEDFDKDVMEPKEIHFSLRSRDIESEDLKAICQINTIASNSKQMAELLKDKK